MEKRQQRGHGAQKGDDIGSQEEVQEYRKLTLEKIGQMEGKEKRQAMERGKGQKENGLVV